MKQKQGRDIAISYHQLANSYQCTIPLEISQELVFTTPHTACCFAAATTAPLPGVALLHI